MAIGRTSEKVLRATLQALQRGGFLASGSDVSALEGVPNDASDADISLILDSISFGGLVADADSLISDTDVNVFIDANDDDSPISAVRYFRVAEDQNSAPVTDENNELMTLGNEVTGLTTTAVTLRLGPRLTISTSPHDASLVLGNDGSDNYGGINAGADVIGGTGTNPGMSVYSIKEMDLRSGTDINVRKFDGTVLRGGWSDVQNQTQFNVGDFDATESLAIETETSSGGKDHFNIRPTRPDAVRKIFVRGSNSSDGYKVHFAVGGKLEESWGDPDNFGEPTLLVVSTPINDDNGAFYVYDRRTNRSAGTEVATIKSAATVGGTYYLFRAYVGADPIFNIDSAGNVNIDIGKSYTNAGGDVAELVNTDKPYDPGTVLCIENGSYVAASAFSSSSVAGIVATSPAVLLGTTRKYSMAKAVAVTPQHISDEVVDSFTLSGDYTEKIGDFIRLGEKRYVPIRKAELSQGNTIVHLRESVQLDDNDFLWVGVELTDNVAELALTGIVPTICSTENGDITGNGELLVSGSGGYAVLAPEDPKPGTVIGKAIGKLIQTGQTPVKGIIDVQVNLQ